MITPEFDVLGIGTVAVDDMVYVERYPPPDQKAAILSESRNLGGQVATALAAARRLGARCAYLGILGGDELSAAARAGFLDESIDCRFVRNVPDAGPIHSVIVVDAKSKTRNIFYDARRMRPAAPEDAPPEIVARARVLLVDQLGPDGAIGAARCAAALGVPVVADMEWTGAPRIAELILAVDHLLVPRDFASEVTGLTDPERIVPALHEGARRTCTAVTCGKEGTYFTLSGSSGVRHVAAFEVETVETTGCGDVFHGAYAAALARGEELPTCLRFASAAAAVWASRPSGWRHLPSADDVHRLLSRDSNNR